MNNNDLIKLALQGDKNAITQLYNDNVNEVYFLCLNLLKNPDDASDITQDTFVKVLTNLNSLKNPESFSPWILRIATNLCKDFLKKSNRFYITDNADSLTNLIESEENGISIFPEEYVDNSETRHLVMGIIDNLPDGQRMAIILFYYNNMSISEISEILECSQSAVKARLFYGRKRIKEEVQKLERKGTKLYGTAPIILLLGNIFEKEASNFPISALPSATNLLSKLPNSITDSLNQTTKSTFNSSSVTMAERINMIPNFTKIIIVTVAGTAIVGGAITTTVILNNKPEPILETEFSKYENDMSKSESELKPAESSEKSLVVSEVQSKPQGNLEERLKLLSANFISSSIQNVDVMQHPNVPREYGAEKVTILTYLLKSKSKRDTIESILGDKNKLAYLDENGKSIENEHNIYPLNDGSRLYIVKLFGVYDISKIDIKIKNDRYYNIKYNRNETKIESKSGEIEYGDIITINKRQYFFSGIKNNGSALHWDEKSGDYISYYYCYVPVFIPLDSKYEKTLDKNSLIFDRTESEKLPLPKGYKNYYSLSCNDKEILTKFRDSNSSYDQCELYEIQIGCSYNEENKTVDDLRSNDDYFRAMKISYTDGDYSFSINVKNYENKIENH